MKIFKTNSLILKKKIVNENNILCSIISKDLGYIDALAFGANTISKRFRGNLDYFKVLELEIKKSNKNDLFNLTSSNKIIYDFNNISQNINKYYQACFVLELSALTLHHNEIESKNMKNYFDIIYNTLEYINENALINNEFALKFSLKIFKETGFIPENYKLSSKAILKSFVSNIVNPVPKSLKYL